MKSQTITELVFLGLDGHLYRRLHGGDLTGAERALVALLEWARSERDLENLARILARSLAEFGIVAVEEVDSTEKVSS